MSDLSATQLGAYDTLDVMEALMLEEERKLAKAKPPAAGPAEETASDAVAFNPMTQIFWDKHIRILGTVTDPLFCAKDIAAHIGDVNYVRTLRGYKADATEATGAYICTIISLDARGLSRNTLYLTEKGLYRYLLRSDLPKAIEFQSYVYDLLKAERKRIIDSTLLALKIERTQKAELQTEKDRAVLEKRMARSETDEVMRVANDARIEVKKANAKLAWLEGQQRGGANARIIAAEEANRARGCMGTFKPAY
jgi:prophage antirepressor-like protein